MYKAKTAAKKTPNVLRLQSVSFLKLRYLKELTMKPAKKYTARATTTGFTIATFGTSRANNT